MGYLTTITIHNDALHAFQKKPEAFAKAIFDGIKTAQRERSAADIAFHCDNSSYGGYITVEPPRHADDETVFVHSGNTVFNINASNDDMRVAIEGNIEYAKRVVLIAERIVKEAKRAIKDAEQIHEDCKDA